MMTRHQALEEAPGDAEVKAILEALRVPTLGRNDAAQRSA